MRKHSDNSKAIAAFIATKAETDAMLQRLPTANRESPACLGRARECMPDAQAACCPLPASVQRERLSAPAPSQAHYARDGKHLIKVSTAFRL